MGRRGDEVSGCADAVDILEGGSLLVTAEELASLPEVRIHGLPEGFVGRRLKIDCVLVGWQAHGKTWALRLNSCAIKPRLVELLESRIS